MCSLGRPVSNKGAALLAVVVVPAPALLAERDPAQAQDPAEEAQNPEQDPLVNGLFGLDLGQPILSARVTAHLERLHVPSRYAVRGHHGRGRRSYDIRHCVLLGTAVR